MSVRSLVVDSVVLHNWSLQCIGRRIFLFRFNLYLNIFKYSAFPVYASIGHFICGKTKHSVLLIKKRGGKLKIST